jgi:hypothetical protein
MIISNQGRCKLCGDTPFSAHRHDFSSCKCGEIAVDGGTSYLRRVAGSFDNFIEMSIEIKDEAFKAITAELDEAIEAGVFGPADFVVLTFKLLEDHDIVPLVKEDIDVTTIRRAAREGVDWALTTGRNGFGLLSAVMRHVRDAGSGWEGEGTEID